VAETAGDEEDFSVGDALFVGDVFDNKVGDAVGQSAVLGECIAGKGFTEDAFAGGHVVE